MTESEWLTQTNSQKMLIHLGDETSKRKLRLFCVGCVQRILPRLSGAEIARQAIELAERYADGECSSDELLSSASKAAEAIPTAPTYEEKNALRAVAWTVGVRMDAIGIARSVSEATALASGEGTAIEKSIQADILRELFGNPFQPQEAIQQFLTNDIVSSAKKMYTIRDFTLMPELSRSLELAGWSDANVLEHCRKRGAHVRGCWALDLILGMQ